MTEHEHALELMPGYALGSLSSAENRLVERHTAACPACAHLLQQYQATVGDLPEAIVMVDPPADLRTRILARAAAGREGATDGAGAHRPARPAAAAPAARSWRERLAALFSGQAGALALAGAALIAVLALANALLWMRLNRDESGSTLRTVALQAEPAAPGATGTLVISLDGAHGTLVVDGLPALAEDQQYQLWLIDDSGRTSGGVFSVSPEGYGSVWIDSPRPLASYQSVGITVEPSGGSPAPTGDKVLGGSL
jgi:anti-sigma-K factor RskA